MTTTYSVLPYLQKRWTAVTRSHAYRAKSPAEHRAWRGKLASKLKSLTGYDTMQRCPLKARVTESVACDGYRRDRIEIQTEPGVVMPLYALVPDAPTPRGGFASVLCPHGHASGGKFSPAGRTDIEQLRDTITQHNYDYGVQYAKAGLIAFCPDGRGAGERQEPSLNADGNLRIQSCLNINNMAFPLGQTVTGMWTWDLHRLLDYVQTRKDCDPDRIGCAGLSGGGLQTLWAAALDERIKAAVVSGYFYGYRESLLVMHTNCSCNYVPHLYETADMGDIAALIAPRPLLIETGDQDPLNGESGVRNVTSQVAITRKAYKNFGATNSLVHDIFEGGHLWHGKLSVPWLKAQLTRDA